MANTIFSRGCLGVASLAIATAIATPAAQATNFAQAQQVNAATLRSFTWKGRTELKRKGEVVTVRLEQVRYDLDGRLQRTPIGGSDPSQEPAGRGRAGGPLRQHAVAKKKEEFKELITDLAALADAYAHLPQDRLQAFMAHSTTARDEGVGDGSLRIAGDNVLTAGDEMSVWIDPLSARMRRVEIRTVMEGKPVRILVEYRELETGVTYPARSVLTYSAEQLELTVENFDYHRANL